MAKTIHLQRNVYSSAKISVMRGNLYGDDKLKELTKLNFDEILRFLEEHGFRKSVDKSYLQYEGFYLVERVLNDHLSKIYKKVIQGASSKNKLLLESYYLKYQVHNLLVVVRCKLSDEKDFEAYLIGDERRKQKYLKAFEMNKIEDAIVYMSKKLGFNEEEVLEYYNKGVFDLENYLYKTYYQKLKSFNFKYNNIDEQKFIKFTREYIDLLNARSYLKLKIEEAKIDFEEIFIAGGNLNLSKFKDLNSKKSDECMVYFKEVFGSSDMSLDSNSPESLDRKISSHKKKAENLFRPAKFGSPFYSLRFLFKIEREIGMLRVLLKSKYLKLDEKEITELLGLNKNE